MYILISGCSISWVLSTLIVLASVVSGIYLVAVTFPWYIYSNGTVILGADDTILVADGFDPYAFGSVKFTNIEPADHHQLFFHHERCIALDKLNKSIKVDNSFSLTEFLSNVRTLQLDQRYLLVNSNLSYFINVSSFDSPDCVASLYLYRDYISFAQFLSLGVRSEFIERISICDSTEQTYVLTPSKNAYYFLGVYLPESTSVEVINISISGTVYYYRNPALPPSCQINPVFDSSCEVSLKEFETSKPNGPKVCILATRDSINSIEDKDFSQFNYTASSTTFISVGSIFGLLVVIFGGTLLCTLLCVCLPIVCICIFAYNRC